MHALATPAFEGAPRVWLVTRPVAQRAPRPRRLQLSPATFLHPLVAAAVFVLASVALIAAVLLSRGTQFFIIDGHGLEPSIPSGSLAVAEPLGDRLLTVGEIITMSDNGQAPVSGYISEVVHGADGIRYSARTVGDDTAEPRVLGPSTGVGRVGLFVPHAADALDMLLGIMGRTAVATFAVLVVMFRAGPLIVRRIRLASGLAKP